MDPKKNWIVNITKKLNGINAITPNIENKLESFKNLIFAPYK